MQGSGTRISRPILERRSEHLREPAPELAQLLSLLKSDLKATVPSFKTYAKETTLTKDPRSAGDAISVITPYAIEKVPVSLST